MSTQQITFDLFWIIHWSKRASTWMESWRGHCHIILGQKEERDSSQRRKKNVHQSVLQAGLIWFSRTPFGVLPTTFDSDVQMICSLMLWKDSRMAYKYVSNSHLHGRLLRGSNFSTYKPTFHCFSIYVFTLIKTFKLVLLNLYLTDLHPSISGTLYKPSISL